MGSDCILIIAYFFTSFMITKSYSEFKAVFFSNDQVRYYRFLKHLRHVLRQNAKTRIENFPHARVS